MERDMPIKGRLRDSVGHRFLDGQARSHQQICETSAYLNNK